ncbi:class I SAM-dependent methyltransferase [Spirosoma profusum]|uniref:class I SAM-dependent methyltransferase n=1 Tax=Spirosoma profusum TaxID=2771354 RepID=UPI001CC23996|nr:class I SAM-dependent methyltransferase [Spirosoma profusum]
MEDPKCIVQRGYDQLGTRYRTHYEQLNPDRYNDWLIAFARLLPKDASVLELGCADGIPTAHFLSQQFDYLGVDISPVQIQQARANVPNARFEVADMASLNFPALSFDGVLALYSIIHLPIAEQPALFNEVYNWLKAEGYFLCITGAQAWTGTDEDWNQLGTSMYWSHTDAITYQSWFLEIGFTILDTHFVAEGDGGHTYFLLRK